MIIMMTMGLSSSEKLYSFSDMYQGLAAAADDQQVVNYIGQDAVVTDCFELSFVLVVLDNDIIYHYQDGLIDGVL